MLDVIVGVLNGVNLAFNAAVGATKVGALASAGAAIMVPMNLPLDMQKDQIYALDLKLNYALNCRFIGKIFPYDQTVAGAEGQENRAQGYAFVITHRECGREAPEPVAIVGQTHTLLGAGNGIDAELVQNIEQANRPAWTRKLSPAAAADPDIVRVVSTATAAEKNAEWYKEKSDVRERNRFLHQYRPNPSTSELDHQWYVAYRENRGWLSKSEVKQVLKEKPITPLETLMSFP